VLPFENGSGEMDTEYLSDGITRSLTNSLATLPRLRVVAQSIVFRYKGRKDDPQTVGSQLGVRAILTGTVVQRGGSLLIMAELVDTASGSHLWGGHYNRKLDDIFVLQEEIANEISERLRLRLTRAEKKGLVKRHTENAEAYQLYLKGRYHWDKWTPEGFAKGMNYFEQAVGQDPGYSLAHAGLADSYLLLGWNSLLPPADAFAKANAAARKALQFDKDLAEAHTSLAAQLWLHDWNFAKAEQKFCRSLELRPSYATAHHWYAEYLMTMGRMEESLSQIKRSLELDPLSLIINVAFGWMLYHAARYEEAIEQLKQTLELEPNYPVTHWILGLVHRETGHCDVAVTEGEKAVSFSDGVPLLRAALAHTYAIAGRTIQSRNILGDLNQLAKETYVSPYCLAGIHAGLQELDRAVEYLEDAIKEKSHWLLYLRIDPGMNTVRGNAHLQELLFSAGLAFAHPEMLGHHRVIERS
jgi:TolB-like protein/Tfp pilus assembly protein PilF